MTYAQQAAESLQRLRSTTPLVHNITNFVAMDISANALLAVGASPAMVHAEAEVADFARMSSALVVNIGTLSPSWVSAMFGAARVARERKIPIVLDPVGAGATPYRTRVASQLLQEGLSVVRGNASEILALAGAAVGPTRGVDSTAGVDEAVAAAEALAESLSVIVAVTGEVDLVTDGSRRLRVEGGHPWMTQVTAVGCALSAVLGAFVAVRSDASLDAVAHGLAIYGLAGSRAGARAEGPGSFRTALMDALANLTAEDVAREAKIAES